MSFVILMLLLERASEMMMLVAYASFTLYFFRDIRGIGEQDWETKKVDPKTCRKERYFAEKRRPTDQAIFLGVCICASCVPLLVSLSFCLLVLLFLFPRLRLIQFSFFFSCRFFVSSSFPFFPFSPVARNI